MNKAKFFGVICLVFAFFSTVLVGLIFIFPIRDILLRYNSNPENSTTNFMAIIFLYAFIGFLPLVFGLLSFYYTDGIGDNLFSKILVIVVLVTVLLIPILGGIVFLILTKVQQETVGLFLVILYLCMLSYPIIFTVAALIVGKVNLWMRFIPILAFVLWFIIPLILGGITVAIVSSLGVNKSGFLYKGVMQATIPQWLLLGSITWSLLSVPAFFIKEQKNDEGRNYFPPSPQENFS